MRERRIAAKDVATSDLAAAAALAGISGVPEKPFAIKSSVELSGTRLQIEDTRFDVGDNHLTVTGLMTELNWLIRMKPISIRAVRNAPLRNSVASSWSCD